MLLATRKKKDTWTSFFVSFITVMVCSTILDRLNDTLCADETKSENSAAEYRFFETEVRPLLAEHCWSCHGPEKIKGGLRLDSKDSLMQGGDSGETVIPGKPQQSLLMEAVRYESLEMPPDGQLPSEKIAVLARWIEMGAHWPETDADPTARAPGDRFTEEDRRWWAMMPVVRPVVPTLTRESTSRQDSWTSNPIDAFILDRMNREGLTPAREADRVSLLRRVAYDLTGLPPTQTQVQTFVNDGSANAYEKIVEELLDSPRFGERWARHWLDLVRYADSDGYRIDHYRPTAWRYRDYVIAAFNSDKPYDRFVQEQLAGDELFPNDDQAHIATGYLRHWIYEYNNRDVRSQWTTIMNDLADTTSNVFMGLGLQCAKCHDHKFDPLLQRDYFRLQAFFAPIQPQERIVANSEEREEYAVQLKAWEAVTADLREQIATAEAKHRENAAVDAISKFPSEIQAVLTMPESERTPHQNQLYAIAYRQIDYEYNRLDTLIKGDDKELLIALRKQLSQFDESKPKPLARAMTISDVGPESPPLFIPKRAKRPVAPGFPTLMEESDAVVEPIETLPTTGRRAALAKWLTRPDNPLTARVMVNRLWQYHFGRGLAANASDFGRLGGAPSHPELLDWLASEFVEGGWSLKKMHRLMVTSATYRQSTHHALFQDQQRLDPANQFYWRGDTRRLDAEQIRDSMLEVAGTLKQAHGTTDPANSGGIDGGEGVLADIPRRTIYTRVMRNDRNPLLDVFDLPQFFSSESSRNHTTTPVQSLLLINSPEVLRHAASFADRVWNETDQPAERIDRVFQLAYSRRPNPRELEAAMEYLSEGEKQLSRQAKIELVEVHARRETGRIPYRDGQAIYVSEDKPPMQIEDDRRLDLNSLSIEAYFQIRSVDESASVRTAIAKWSGKQGEPGWSFGVTGKGSRRKPQTLVVVLWGKKRDGSFGESAVFSDQLVELNKPYFAAATIEPANDKPGSVTFYLKDLSNDDDPIQIAQIEHDIVGGFENKEPLTIGGCGSKNRSVFDGLIDDVRLSREVIAESRLLLTSESVSERTVGYWRFEAEPGVMRDSSSNAMDISTIDREKIQLTNQEIARTAFVDFCHAVLNSNEFLYVD